MNSIIKTIQNRRSIRKYKNKPIPKNMIMQIIEAGKYAPSSHNSQPWRFIIITNKKKIKELSSYVKQWFKKRLILGKIISIFNKKIASELSSAEKRLDTEDDLFFYNAPLLILITAKPRRFTEKDCSCAAQNMFLAARSLNIGSCWIGFADMAINKDRKLMQSLGMPKQHKIYAHLIFGYPEKFPSKAYSRKEGAIINWI